MRCVRGETTVTIVGLKSFPDGQPKVQPFRGVGGTNRSGSVLVFMDNLMGRLNVPWQEVAISARSREYSPSSSFTACVHDVAIGHLDTCWANFWPTGSRRQIASFTGALYHDNFHVVVRSGKKEQTFADSLYRPFQPFTAELWMLIMTAFGFIGVSLTWSQSTEEHWKSCGGVLVHAPANIFKGWHGFGTGEVRQVVVRSAGGWLTQFAMGFSKTVLVAAYTSLMTSNILTETTTEVNTFKEAQDARYRYCANPDIVPALISQYPSLGQYMVETQKDEILDAIDRGECEAAIISTNQWRNERLWGQRHHCDTKVALADAFCVRAHTVYCNCTPGVPKCMRAPL